ncbi:double-strand break repair protein MRE11 [Octopus sinensis]|uniref:Double-strand break repair protein n=1 Tax=Octopus sinensis TaxID=2607531 RepID=A0A6P7TGP6_9MOLL|nr:double-strand break repair protein MRE11 [Octopus sinensis]
MVIAEIYPALLRFKKQKIMVSQDGSEDNSHQFKILLASDIHLGYMENDSVRGNDSLVTFEEILEKAKQNDVDFILFGGDLFHENKPSRSILHGCLALLRKYCMGDKPIQFEFVSDQSVNFEHCTFPSLNYDDPNLNISYPIFSIHGNHDDPTGQGNLCSLDLFHTIGLINYFGKCTSLDKIVLSPLLLQKGRTKLALFGLGSIQDERLHRMFLKKNVSMLRPREDKEDWFNVCVLHQNRAKHSATKYIPEQFLDDFIDLVVWGHEHECRIDPEWNNVQNFYVCQPGSSIATSLSPAEAVQKHVALLYIDGKNFKISKLPLETVRQFYTEDIVLMETNLKPDDLKISKKMEDFCAEKVDSYVRLAESSHTGHAKQPKKPLIRLRVDYSGGYEPFSSFRFGQRFVDKVANLKDIVTFHRKKEIEMNKTDISVADSKVLTNFKTESLDAARVEDIVKKHFQNAEPKKKLQILTEKGLGYAVNEFVEKEEKEAIADIVKYQLSETQKYLNQKQLTSEENIYSIVQHYKEERAKKNESNDDLSEALKESQSRTFSTAKSSNVQHDKDGNESCSSNESLVLDDDSDDFGVTNDNAVPSKSKRGRGRGGKETTTSRGRSRGRGSRGSRSKAQVVTESRPSSLLSSYFTQKSKRKLSESE